jgi:hypothetical protein
MRLPSLLLPVALLAWTSLARADDVVPPERHMASVPLLVSGITLTVAGTVMFPFGVLLLAAGEPQPQCMGCSIYYTGRRVFEGVLIAGGASAVLAGIPMIVLGSRRVPVAVGLVGPERSLGLTVAGRF